MSIAKKFRAISTASGMFCLAACAGTQTQVPLSTSEAALLLKHGEALKERSDLLKKFNEQCQELMTLGYTKEAANCEIDLAVSLGEAKRDLESYKFEIQRSFPNANLE